jgi:hypothetical protein
MYSDNAPALEGALHGLFCGQKVNLVNSRKEFYRDVELDEIESFVRQRGLSAQFVKVPEAREYRETLAAREAKSAAVVSSSAALNGDFPEALFKSASA